MSSEYALQEAAENMQIGGNLTNESVRNYLLALSFPEKKSTAPPPFYTGMVFGSPVQGSFLRTIGDQTTKINERVRDDTFMLIWWPTLGANTMWNFGFVPRNATSYPGAPISITPNLVPNTPRGMNTTQPVIAMIVFNSTLAIPFASQPGQTQMAFGIDLAENFSLVRSTSGMISLYSDTIASGQFDLTGNVTASVITDTRDVARTADKDGYPAAALRSAAAAKSENVFQHGVKDGCIVLAGPPQTQTFQSPEYDIRVETVGDFIVFDSSNFVAGAAATGPSPGTSTQVQDGYVYQWNNQVWVTPWDTDVLAYPSQDTSGISRPQTDTVAAGVQHLHLPAIDELGVMSFEVDVYLTPNAWVPSAGTVYVLLQTVVQATHVFAVAELDGGLTYTQIDECRTGRVISTLGMQRGSVSAQQIETFKFNPCVHRETGFGVTGKYIGTLISVGAAPLYNDTSITNETGPITTGGFKRISVVANTVNLPGACGPVRILRADSIGQGQTVKCETTVNFQAVAQTNLAPFVKEAVAYSPVMTSLQGVVAAQLLFGANGRFRRVYKRSDYEAMWEIVKDMSLEKLLSYAGEDPNQVAALSASGVWDAIAAGLGGMNTAMRLYGGAGEAAGQWRHARLHGPASSADAAGTWGYDPMSQLAGSGAMSSASGPWRRQRM